MTATEARAQMMDVSLSVLYVCARTGRKSGAGPRRLHLLPCVRQHVVTLGFVHQIATRL